MFTRNALIRTLAAASLSVACGANGPMEDVQDLSQELNVNPVNHIAAQRRFNRSAIDVYQTAGCVWNYDAQGWHNLHCPSDAPTGVGGVSLPPDGRRCVFWVSKTSAGPRAVFYKCEATAFQGDWSSTQSFSATTTSTSTPSVEVLRIFAIGASKTGEIPAVFALGYDNTLMVRWYVDGKWSPRWCFLGENRAPLPNILQGAMHDLTVHYSEGGTPVAPYFQLYGLSNSDNPSTGILWYWRPPNVDYLRLGNCALSSNAFDGQLREPTDRIAVLPEAKYSIVDSVFLPSGGVPQPELFEALRAVPASTTTFFQNRIFASSVDGNVYWKNDYGSDRSWHLLP